MMAQQRNVVQTGLSVWKVPPDGLCHMQPPLLQSVRSERPTLFPRGYPGDLLNFDVSTVRPYDLSARRGQTLASSAVKPKAR